MSIIEVRELIKRYGDQTGGVPSRILVLTTYDTDSDVLPAIEAGPPGTC